MTRMIFLFIGLLAGCAPQARDIALTDVDLRDMEAVAAIRAQLLPHERAAFASFLVRHHISSANFCGQPLISTHGRAPETIGEAVDLAIDRDAAEAKALAEANKPKHPRHRAKEEWDNLITARDILMDSQSRLRIEHGEKALRRSEWKSLSTKMAEIDRKLVSMKEKVYGPDSQ
ncbi:hypothetical protein [Sphingorhabdus sp.]|uniref:hypothetical protein n=1 Tax=Sphingorhabdus sp. TaxID=1902408 RepID=UPI00391C6E67